MIAEEWSQEWFKPGIVLVISWIISLLQKKSPSSPLLHTILLRKNTSARGNVLDAQYDCSQVDIQYQNEASLYEKVPVPTIQSPESTS